MMRMMFSIYDECFLTLSNRKFRRRMAQKRPSRSRA